MKWNKEELENLKNDYHNHLSIKELALKYKRSENSIRLRLKNEKRKFYDRFDQKFIIKLYLEGKSIYEISKIVENINSVAVWRILKLNKIQSRPLEISNRRYNLNINYFNEINTKDKAYFLGLLYADGYNNFDKGTVSISLQKKDGDLLELFNKYINHNKPLYEVEYKNIFPQLRIEFGSKKLSSDLNKLGCVQKKSLILKFPTIEQVPEHLQRHFIRGYFDGDGCIVNSKNKLTWNIVSTKSFCQDVQKILVNDLNLNFTKLSKKTSELSNNFIYSLIYGGRKQVAKIYNWLYEDCDDLYLKRKKDKYDL